MHEAIIILVCLVVVASLEGLFHIARWLGARRETEIKRRLRLLAESTDVPQVGLLRRERFAASPALNDLLRAMPGTRPLEQLLAQADSRLSVAQVLAWSGGCLALGVVVPLLLPIGALAGLMLGTAGAVAPLLMATMARSRRSAQLSEQLPEALDMMSRSLRAGHALPAAFRLVASEMPTPVSVEFARACEEQTLGLPAEQAVVNMTLRTPLNRDLKIFAVSVVVQKETGGNLAEILEKIGTTIRDRYRFYSKLRALTAEGRTSGLVLASLPLGMGLFLGVSRPEYLGKLFDNPIGQVIFAFAVLSWLSGVFWMFRMTKVEF